MSFDCVAWAFNIGNITPVQKLLLLTLANYADEDGKCWPSQRKLCGITGAARRTVQRGLLSLEELGLVQREKRTDNAGHQKSDVFRLALEGRHIDRGGRHNGTPRGVTDAPNTITEPINKEKDKKESSPKRTHRLPEDWMLDGAACAYAVDRDFDEARIRAEAENFRDYHLKHASKFVDWNAAWRTWVRKAIEFKPPEKPPDNVIHLTPEHEAEYQRLRDIGEMSEAAAYRKKVGSVSAVQGNSL